MVRGKTGRIPALEAVSLTLGTDTSAVASQGRTQFTQNTLIQDGRVRGDECLPDRPGACLGTSQYKHPCIVITNPFFG